MKAPFVIQESNKTPKVSFDTESGVFEILGRSIPEDSHKFFKPVLDYLEAYSQHPSSRTSLIFKLDYFNTSSSMYFLKMLRKLELLYQNNYQVEVKWYYDSDDEDMYQTGEDLQQIVKFPFHLIKISA